MSLYYEVDFENVPEERFDVGASFRTHSVQTRPRNVGAEVKPELGNLSRIVELFEEIKKNGVMEVFAPRQNREAIKELNSAAEHKNVLIWDVRLTMDRATLLRLHVGKSTISMRASSNEGDLTVIVNVSDVSVHRA